MSSLALIHSIEHCVLLVVQSHSSSSFFWKGICLVARLRHRLRRKNRSTIQDIMPSYSAAKFVRGGNEATQQDGHVAAACFTLSASPCELKCSVGIIRLAES